MRGAAAAARTAVAVAGCGGHSSGAALKWTATPRVVQPPRLPHDRIAYGTVRNGSKKAVELTATRLRVLDAAGRTLPSAVVFSQTFAHGLYGAYQPSPQPDRFDQHRIGKLAYLLPGQSAPLTISWRPAPGTGRAVRVDYGSGSLPLP